MSAENPTFSEEPADKGEVEAKAEFAQELDTVADLVAAVRIDGDPTAKITLQEYGYDYGVVEDYVARNDRPEGLSNRQLGEKMLIAKRMQDIQDNSPDKNK